ncbi:MAG: four helix bundle protein, partial [Cyclobacteriaceae bacterium]
IAKQIIRSGTSIGANSNEAQDSESKADFVHKLKIAAKEARETRYWLELCKRSDSYPFDETLLTDLDSIQKVLNKIIATSKMK